MYAQHPDTLAARRLTNAAHRIYDWLDLQAGRMRKRDGRVFFGQAEIAAATGYSRRTVQRAIAALVAAEAIAIEREHGVADGIYGYTVRHRVASGMSPGGVRNVATSPARPLSDQREHSKRTHARSRASYVSGQAIRDRAPDHGPYERAVHRD